MIQLPAFELNSVPAAYLKKWQAEIDAMPAYADRVQEGKDKFSARNTVRNATFTHVKEVLTRMCQGSRRCGYCEDSVADEVEHIAPKDLYPEAVFSWDNYLYACGPCNGPKNNKYAIIAGNPAARVHVTRAAGAPVIPPQAGASALINPRTEDPLQFLFLDILNTFIFVPREELDSANWLRAMYTIEVLRLNDRDYLVDARRTAFGTYRARFGEYVNEKAAGAAQADLDLHRDELLKVGHQTVWREMQRQHASYPVLAKLFHSAPEALNW
jgi:uncharacterized protein (TIGR02646 family)